MTAVGGAGAAKGARKFLENRKASKSSSSGSKSSCQRRKRSMEEQIQVINYDLPDLSPSTKQLLPGSFKSFNLTEWEETKTGN